LRRSACKRWSTTAAKSTRNTTRNSRMALPSRGIAPLSASAALACGPPRRAPSTTTTYARSTGEFRSRASTHRLLADGRKERSPRRSMPSAGFTSAPSDKEQEHEEGCAGPCTRGCAALHRRVERLCGQPLVYFADKLGFAQRRTNL